MFLLVTEDTELEKCLRVEKERHGNKEMISIFDQPKFFWKDKSKKVFSKDNLVDDNQLERLTFLAHGYRDDQGKYYYGCNEANRADGGMTPEKFVERLHNNLLRFKGVAEKVKKIDLVGCDIGLEKPPEKSYIQRVAELLEERGHGHIEVRGITFKDEDNSYNHMIGYVPIQLTQTLSARLYDDEQSKVFFRASSEYKAIKKQKEVLDTAKAEISKLESLVNTLPEIIAQEKEKLETLKSTHTSLETELKELKEKLVSKGGKKFNGWSMPGVYQYKDIKDTEEKIQEKLIKLKAFRLDAVDKIFEIDIDIGDKKNEINELVDKFQEKNQIKTYANLVGHINYVKSHNFSNGDELIQRSQTELKKYTKYASIKNISNLVNRYQTIHEFEFRKRTLEVDLQKHNENMQTISDPTLKDIEQAKFELTNKTKFLRSEIDYIASISSNPSALKKYAYYTMLKNYYLTSRLPNKVQKIQEVDGEFKKLGDFSKEKYLSTLVNKYKEVSDLNNEIKSLDTLKDEYTKAIGNYETAVSQFANVKDDLKNYHEKNYLKQDMEKMESKIASNERSLIRAKSDLKLAKDYTYRNVLNKEAAITMEYPVKLEAYKRAREESTLRPELQGQGIRDVLDKTPGFHINPKNDATNPKKRKNPTGGRIGTKKDEEVKKNKVSKDETVNQEKEGTEVFSPVQFNVSFGNFTQIPLMSERDRLLERIKAETERERQHDEPYQVKSASKWAQRNDMQVDESHAFKFTPPVDSKLSPTSSHDEKDEIMKDDMEDGMEVEEPKSTFTFGKSK